MVTPGSGLSINNYMSNVTALDLFPWVYLHYSHHFFLFHYFPFLLLPSDSLCPEFTLKSNWLVWFWRKTQTFNLFKYLKLLKVINWQIISNGTLLPLRTLYWASETNLNLTSLLSMCLCSFYFAIDCNLTFLINLPCSLRCCIRVVSLLFYFLSFILLSILVCYFLSSNLLIWNLLVKVNQFNQNKLLFIVNCILTHFYFIFFRKNSLPQFNEAFEGYGMNKVTHVMELFASGFKFLVLPDGWLIHMPHKTSLNSIEFLQSPIERVRNRFLRFKFTHSLDLKYNVTRNNRCNWAI